nr:hypothetical protein [Tanacetum cinerariifolium]
MTRGFVRQSNMRCWGKDLALFRCRCMYRRVRCEEKDENGSKKKSGLKKGKRLMLNIGRSPLVVMMMTITILQSHQMNPLTLSVYEHLNTISATKSDEFIKSCVEKLVSNPSESEGENSCDVPACFTTFSNILFDADYESESSDYQSCSDEDFPEEIFSNPLFEEEIIPIKIDQHHFNVESDLIESMLNHDSSIIPSFLKIDSLLDEFIDELSLLKSIPSGIDKTDCYSEEDIRFIERLLYDNSSPHPPKEFVSENSYAKIESFSPSPIPNEDSHYLIEEMDLSCTSDNPLPPSIEDDDDDNSKRDILLHEELFDNYSLSLPVIESFYFDIPSFSRPPVKPPDDLFHLELSLAIAVKDNQEKDKIKTKPDKNGKHGRARRCQKPVTLEKAEKEKKIQL